MSGVDWTAINKKLPSGSSKAEHERRKKMFRDIDPNKNGILSLQEVGRAIRGILKIDAVFDMQPAITRAFHIAKDSRPSKLGCGRDYIELNEFRFFLLSLRQYLEYYVAFARVDSDSDCAISLEEFKKGQHKVEVWVGKIDAEKVFNEIDTNHGGSILFDEFCMWAIKKNLDLEDDDDNVAQ